MSDKGFERLMGFICGSGLTICLWAFVAGNAFDTAQRLRRDAIEAGVAQWTIDCKTGERRFEWTKCQ